MTALMNQSGAMNSVRSLQDRGPAIEAAPLVGPELTIRVALTPGTVTLVAAPLTVAITMVIGWVALTSLGIQDFEREMVGGGIVNAVGGMLASLPLFVWMKRGAEAIAKAGILSIVVRCAMILMGLVVLFAPAWGMHKTTVMYWVLAYYFPLLIVETAVVAWLSQRAKH